MRKIIAVLVILCVCMLGTAWPANIDRQIKTQQQAQSDMKKKIEKYNEIARQKSKQSKTLLTQLSRLRQSASASGEQIADLERDNARLNITITELNRDIARTNESIAKIVATLKTRLVDLYKFTPDENSFSVILSAGGPHEAVNTAYLLRRFARQDIAMLRQLTDYEQRLTEAVQKLESSKKKIAAQTDTLRQKRAEFDSAVQKTDTLLRSVQTEQKKAEEASRELQAAQRAVGSKINALMSQKKKAQAKKAQAPVAGARAAVPAQRTTSASGPKSLSWPLQGTVVMQYGSRVHPTFKTKIFNSGIDIKAASGTAVKAAGPGEVLYQGWLKGFGQVVIIDHGGDLSTVYAHLGGATVREGAKVSTGTVIGRVGNTGANSEYGLHFEVRKNGSAVNPMGWLR